MYVADAKTAEHRYKVQAGRAMGLSVRVSTPIGLLESKHRLTAAWTSLFQIPPAMGSRAHGVGRRSVSDANSNQKPVPDLAATSVLLGKLRSPPVCNGSKTEADRSRQNSNILRGSRSCKRTACYSHTQRVPYHNRGSPNNDRTLLEHLAS